MQLSFDKTCFPLIRIDKAKVQVQLLPVTKVQFERFLAEPNEFDDGWYEAILKLNPRVSYRQFTQDNREGIFITGILPWEALSFARWMGNGFRLPTVREWRMIYSVLKSRKIEGEELRDLVSQFGEGQAKIILERLVEQISHQAQRDELSWLDLSLMHGGLVEWVEEDGRYVGLGAPRSEFYPNLWNPITEVIKPVRGNERLFFFGFRLVR